ncbi:MAG: Asp-tRNA(Asn)/Glu-tRNA(Gln) amidotransferase subunit GatB [Acidobacteriia bacterium]|nr:Asp-tRNA(Asn)/Glu-tRNA(Gln) amidotransferase subunit GatB [Terriglobia bacterium]
MDYEAIIGLEVHAQLQTRTKCFCSCSTEFGAPPNSNTCPVCLGLPGALPVLNREVVRLATRAALALGCRINRVSQFARKNYFYPDLPKGYQISQYDKPLSEDGRVMIPVDGSSKAIGIIRVHIEEDAGKSLHDGFSDSSEKSYIDLNRSGVPLIEIVSAPDLRSAAEAHAYLTELKAILEATAVCNCDMEKGNLRCDANVSVRPQGSKEFGTRTELKNLNSFRFVQKAIDFEFHRQIEILESGGRIVQETRLWNSDEGKSYSMRSKEEAHDYRYFPEPDLLPLVIDEDYRQKILHTMPELPEAKKARFMKDYGLSMADAAWLASSKSASAFYEETAKLTPHFKPLLNWIKGELTAALNKANQEIETCRVTAPHIADLVNLIEDGTISGKIGKIVFEEMFAGGKTAAAIIDEKKLVQINDAASIEAIARQVAAASPENVAKYKSGKTGNLAWFVGQVMKATHGRARPQVVNEVMKKVLEE